MLIYSIIDAVFLTRSRCSRVKADGCFDFEVLSASSTGSCSASSIIILCEKKIEKSYVELRYVLPVVPHL